MGGSAEFYVIFRLDTQRYALPLASVRRVVRAVQVAPVPGAGGWLLGVIDVHGEVVEVASLRKMQGRPERPVSLSDQLVLVNAGAKQVALLVDAVLGVESYSAVQIATQQGHAAAIIKDPEGIIVVCEPVALFNSASNAQLIAR